MCHQLPPASLAPLRRITRSPRPSCERPVPGSHRRFMVHIANGADWHQQPGIAGVRAHLPGAPTWAHLPLTARKLPLALHRPGSRNRPVAALRDAGKLTDTDLWTPATRRRWAHSNRACPQAYLGARGRLPCQSGTPASRHVCAKSSNTDSSTPTVTRKREMLNPGSMPSMRRTVSRASSSLPTRTWAAHK